MSALPEDSIPVLAEALTQAVRSDPSRAEQLLARMEFVAASDPHRELEGFVERARGHVVRSAGNTVQAVKHYRRAMAQFEECGRTIERARTASTLVGALVPMGEFDEALQLAEEARSAFLHAKLPDRAARLDVNVGNLYHSLNRLDEALVYYERAADALRKSDVEATASVLINRSVVLMLLYRFEEASAGFFQAREFSERHGLRALALQSEHNWGCLLFLSGDFSQAFRVIQNAERGFRELGDKAQLAHCQGEMAEILLALNLPEQSLALANCAETAFQESGFSVEALRTQLLAGRSLLRLGRADEALVQFAKVRETYRKGGNPLWSVVADLNSVTALRAKGRVQEALGVALRSREFFRSESHPPFLAAATIAAAQCLIDNHDPRGALSLLDTQISPPSLPSSLQFDTLYLKGCALADSGKPDQARASFRGAVEQLEYLTSNISADLAMVHFLEDKETAYERLAELTPDPHDAFRWADRGRSRTFANFRNSAVVFEGTDQTRRLREGLRKDYREILGAAHGHSLSLFDRIRQSERALLQELMSCEFNRGASVLAAHETPFSCRSDEVLLEYFITEKQVAVFVAAGSSVERVILPITPDDLEREVHFVRFGLMGSGAPEREAALLAHLRRLHDALIAPVEPMLKRRIVFVPHRILNSLPFHLLLGPRGYLVQDYVISYAPSASDYERASRRETASDGTSLILGTDGFDLPAASSEVSVVSRMLPDCSIALNVSIDEIRARLGRASFVHVVSHAIFRAENPSGSLLDLGGDVLAPTDLLDISIEADLVTLAACSTGKTAGKGNAISGFTRAFSLWGVPSLVASLWEVHDEASALLMKKFYENLRLSGDIAGSLRAAMLGVSAVFPHPWYWGAFILMGKSKLGRSWRNPELEHSQQTVPAS